MKKLIASLLIVGSFATPAFAHGGREGAPWVPFMAGGLFGYMVSRPQPTVVYTYPQPVYTPPPQTVYVYPPSAPVTVVPQAGQVCELKSEVINGQIVQGNFCYTR